MIKTLYAAMSMDSQPTTALNATLVSTGMFLFGVAIGLFMGDHLKAAATCSVAAMGMWIGGWLFERSVEKRKALTKEVSNDDAVDAVAASEDTV